MENTKIIKRMKMYKQGIFGILLLLGVGMTLCGTGHGAVIEGSLVVTDVTPVRFCAVWGTQEPATGSVSVFLDPEGTRPWTGAVVKSESLEHPPAEGIGVMKVSVTGLRPDTEYFFRAQTTLKRDNAVYESSLTPVRTEKASVIVRNDVLMQKVDIVGIDPGPGMLVIASLEAASYPITGWMADGVPQGWAAIDTNNFYSKQTRVNLELLGGEVIKLKLFGGSLGSVETEETIPAESGGIQKLSRSVSLTVSGGAQSGAGATGASGGGGGGCFISALGGK
jgi:hypothetical protein